MFPVKSAVVMPHQATSHDYSEYPRIIENADVYEVLCPVNKLTGARENPLELLRTLSNDPKRMRLLDSIMQELPAIASDNRLSDDDKISMMMCRLSTGCPAEDDLYREKLEAIAEPLFKSLGGSSEDAKQEVENSVSFNESDKSIIDNA